MIEFREVSKSFWAGRGRKIVLDRASFRIEEGVNLGILAPNGTGKTTLINMMAGLEQPDEGRIIREGRVSFPLGHRGGVEGSLSAAENARFLARLYGHDPDRVEAFLRWLTDLGDYFDMPVSTYSAGMRQRLTMGLMLAMPFDLYLIDEGLPSAADVGFLRRVRPVLRERLAAATLVIVSHDARIIEALCHRAGVLRDGRLTICPSLAEARRLYDYVG
ncbi:MAG: ATP-binding cassette domain-containing protein [Alphaproteobacteria bacterium]|nr:MAG: ATP-binding cassette domain-containing protein [Alphaproteobacteria bacterium]